MSDAAPRLMTADEFFLWYDDQAEGKRYELVAGRVFPMASERLAHARTKFRVARRLAEAVEAAGLPCEVLSDGMAVVIDDATIYEPDALLRCGPSMPDDTVRIGDPLIVVEVVSPSSRAIDSNAKLAGYFRLATMRHYLVVLTESRIAIHHSRTEHGPVLARIVREGSIELDPPGITLAGLFE